MSKLNVDQRSIGSLFQDAKSNFLIPDYQRPYAWTEEECLTLWNDIFGFAFPDDNCDKFDADNDEYFLGPIVTFKNENKQLEVIDGQQRLTTLLLLLRAFYDRFQNMKDGNSINAKNSIEKCIWKTDEFGNPNKQELKIDSEVATDNDKTEFLDILKTGAIKKGQTSNYAKNYQLFLEKIDEFLNNYPTYFPYLPARIMNNCILLPIEAESQDTALRIFSTLNDRGLPLSDSDIFKAQFYKYYTGLQQKDKFIKRWKSLEELCEKIFHPITGSPMDELFTRYMYYLRAKQGNKSSTTEALRRFYEKDNYSILKSDDTLFDIEDLAKFWEDVDGQNEDRFSPDVLRNLFILNYAPNGMWTYFVSVYYLKNRDSEKKLDDNKFAAFLKLIIAFIWAYSVFKPGVNSLRTPVFAEMVNLINGTDVTFSEYKFDEGQIKNAFEHYSFNNNRPITKSMLAWWALKQPGQKIPNDDTSFDIEHIFARNRANSDKNSQVIIEKLGNKSLLEKRINIRASDYKFEDKKKYYLGYTNKRNEKKDGTEIMELVDLAHSKEDFTENDIINRNDKIINGFIGLLKEESLIAL